MQEEKINHIIPVGDDLIACFERGEDDTKRFARIIAYATYHNEIEPIVMDNYGVIFSLRDENISNIKILPNISE